MTRLHRLLGGHRLSLLLIATTLWSGCVVGPDHVPPCVCAPDQWHQEIENGQHVSVEELREWWWILNDPKLGELIERAKSQNVDLYTAFTRICQARAQVCIAKSDLWPSFFGNAAYQRFLQSQNAFGFGAFLLGASSLWSLQWDVSWELNLFGHVTRQIEAADASLGGTVEAYRDVMVTLLGDVATTYVQIRTLQEQLRLARENALIQEESLELARKRVDGGISPILDLHQAESNLATTEAAIPPFELQLHQALNRLAVLLGEYPGALHCELAQPVPIPSPPEALPFVLPCDVIRQRPDIRQAERRIAMETAELGVAVGDLFPRLSFNGTFGLQSREFSTLFSGDSYGHQFGPSFRWPIWQSGRILCNIKGSDAAVEEAFASYQQIVLLAVEEVENAIVGYHKELARREDLQRAVEASQKSVESVQELYRSGKTNFQNVLDTERTLAIQQNDLAITEGRVIGQLVALYRSLGGGWDPSHHCATRCVRLKCPERCDPNLVEELAAAAAEEPGEDAEEPKKDGEDDVTTDSFEDTEDDYPFGDDSGDLGTSDGETLERLPALDDAETPGGEPFGKENFFDRARRLELKPE